MELLILTKNATPIIGQVAWLMGWLMEGIFYVTDKIASLWGGTGNIGVSIIIFTIIIYMAMLPLTIKQQKFSKMSAIMNPEIQAVQNKYKNSKDPNAMQAMQEETSAIYAKYGVSPTGSCLQLLIQMPILFALYRVIYSIPAYVPMVKKAFLPLVNSVMGIENGVLPASNVDTYIAANNLINSGIKATQNFQGPIKKLDFMLTAKQAADGIALSSDTVTNYLVTSDNAAKNIEQASNIFIDIFNKASMQDWTVIKEFYAGNGDIISKIDTLVSTLAGYNSFLGINIGYSPLEQIKLSWAEKPEGWFLVIGVAVLIPILAAVTQWLNVKLAPTAQDNNNAKPGQEENPMMSSMKTMNMVMPLMSAFWCFTLPAGLGLYWIAGAVIRCVQQVVINKYIDSIDMDKVIEKNIEKYNEKLKKRGVIAEGLNRNANINTKNINAYANKANQNNNNSSKKTAEEIKKATEYYNKMNKNSKSGSIANKANMVKQYNEKNNK